MPVQDEKPDQEQNPSGAASRKPWVTPTLRCYGRITDITAGGSGMMAEGGGGMMGGAANLTRFP